MRIHRPSHAGWAILALAMGGFAIGNTEFVTMGVLPEIAAGNALGAWLGGLVIAAGFGYTATSWVGAGLSAAGLLVLGVSVALHRRHVRSGVADGA